MNFFFVYIFFMSVMSLIIVRNHILLCMISLEFVVLSLLIYILFYCLMFGYSLYLYILYMTFFVCEGALGLGVLVHMIRSYGNDHLNSMFM